MKRRFYRILFVTSCLLVGGILGGCGGGSGNGDDPLDTPEEVEADLEDQQRMIQEEMQ